MDKNHDVAAVVSIHGGIQKLRVVMQIHNIMCNIPMLARIYSCAVVGLEGVIVEVEIDTTQGFPGMDLVGLPDAAVKESAARVQTAIRNAGLPYPRERIVVNLAPASVRKEGPAYDLPIALGIVMMGAV